MYINERHFVKTALQNMEFLEQVWTASTETQFIGQAEDTLSAIEAIKTTAMSVQARGVYRAAILCEDVLSRLNISNMAKMSTSLAELKRLIISYADGLFEIDPEFAEIINQPDIISKPDSDLVQRHADAVQTLSPLMGLVKSPDLRTALKSIMLSKPTSSQDDSHRKTMSLDTLIQPISNLVLSEARLRGKTVTVSYAADFADLPHAVATSVQEMLEAACLKIVTQGISNPDQIDHGPTPQISLTGQSRAGHILFSISWVGAELTASQSSLSEFDIQMRNLQERGGSYSFRKLALTDDLKSRHTLYIKLPIASAASIHASLAQMNAKLEAGGG